MVSFLVEAYTPPATGLADIERRARAAAEAVSTAGPRVHYLRSICVPTDETCFHLFEAETVDAVRDAMAGAGLYALRIVEAIETSVPETAVPEPASA